jgi:HAD superfamily hydrolase (TIGR01549 family)
LLRAIFFDLDDTLFDRKKAQGELLRLVRGDFSELLAGIEEEVAYRAFMDADAETAWQFNSGVPIFDARINRMRAFLNRMGLDGRFAEEVNASYLRHYRAVHPSVSGAASAVRQLAGRYQLGIISNGSPEVQYAKLDGIGIRDLFECVVLSEACGAQKPDRAIFMSALEQVRRQPGECIHIGDSYNNDVLGAKGAGLRSCWFNREGLSVPAGCPPPDFEVRSLSELPGLLEE